MGELERLRKEIDGIDHKILDLLNKRAEVVIEIARIKRNENAKFYSPEREREILERLIAINKGPFPDDTLRVIYREILSASLSLEEPLKVACLGPLATFTHLAALRHFGSSAHFIPVESIREVFDTVEAGKAEFGVVPIENSNEGVVTYTLDMFMDYDLKVSAEVLLEIALNLISNSGDRSKIKKIYSNPHAAAQCRQWLEANFPTAPILETTSTAKAAEFALRDDEAAAVASELAAKVYNLQFVEKNIEDRKHNFTRFLVISKEFPPRTGKDKTSIMFSIKDKPGSLYNILEPFKKAKVNLTKIESRPSKRKAWEYIFFVDMEGHTDDKKLSKAIETVKDNCLYLKILGSYPHGGI
ncbi:MAG: prephenate dehydratase [Nitrospirae bacterium]|jgi:chorismate mutase / prephenate dehydratase|nr:prephenate dehydratase [Nitrospirota bacterium]